jgi:hypothetical protein
VRIELKWHRDKRFPLRSDDREHDRHLIWLERAGLDRACRQGTFICFFAGIHMVKST